MRALVPACVLAFAVLTWPARAADCGNVTEEGLCQDAKTLVFCEAGELEVIRCPLGELCAFDERFNGAAGCIATRYAGCGAVPEQGVCAGSTLLHCADGRVEELECPAGTHCQSLDIDGQAHSNCVAHTNPDGGNGDSEEIPFEPGEDEDDIDDPMPLEPDEGAPLPSVQKGGAGPAADYEAGGGGCGGGGAGLLGLAGLAAIMLRRRRQLVPRISSSSTKSTNYWALRAAAASRPVRD